jgi:hypothetical protein
MIELKTLPFQLYFDDRDFKRGLRLVREERSFP